MTDSFHINSNSLSTTNSALTSHTPSAADTDIKYTTNKLKYEGRSNRAGTFNFIGIKRDASVAVLHTAISGKCVLSLIGGAHIAGQSRDR